MKKSMFQKVICFVLSVATLFSVFALTVAASGSERPKSDTTAATLEEMEALIGTTSYQAYISDYKDANPGSSTITLDNGTAVLSGVKVKEGQEAYYKLPVSENQFCPATTSTLYSSRTRSCVPTSCWADLTHMPLPRLQAKLKTIEILKFPR